MAKLANRRTNVVLISLNWAEAPVFFPQPVTGTSRCRSVVLSATLEPRNCTVRFITDALSLDEALTHTVEPHCCLTTLWKLTPANDLGAVSCSPLLSSGRRTRVSAVRMRRYTTTFPFWQPVRGCPVTTNYVNMPCCVSAHSKTTPPGETIVRRLFLFSELWTRNAAEESACRARHVMVRRQCHHELSIGRFYNLIVIWLIHLVIALVVPIIVIPDGQMFPGSESNAWFHGLPTQRLKDNVLEPKISTFTLLQCLVGMCRGESCLLDMWLLMWFLFS